MIGHSPTLDDLEDPPRLVLIAAATMNVPHDVHKTHNAYNAMCAALVAAEAAGVDRLIVPGMCTGCGMMSAPEVVIKQMRRAHDDFRVGRPALYDAAVIAAEQLRPQSLQGLADVAGRSRWEVQHAVPGSVSGRCGRRAHEIQTHWKAGDLHLVRSDAVLIHDHLPGFFVGHEV